MSDAPTNFDSSTGGVSWIGKDPNVNIEIYTYIGGLRLRKNHEP